MTYKNVHEERKARNGKIIMKHKDNFSLRTKKIIILQYKVENKKIICFTK